MPGLTRFLILILLAASLWLGACPGADPTPPAPAETPLGPIELLTFKPDEDHYLLADHRYPLDPTVSPAIAFQQLADQLNRSYFNDGHDPPSDMRIEILGLYSIDLPHRSLRVVAVNLRDARQAAWTSFFQGSTGGQTTYYLLAATLMQPQLSPPLADGLVVLYNGKAFPELDHIRFRGIVSAESIRPVVIRAIQHRPPRPAGASG